jgi:hypothetical protein
MRSAAQVARELGVRYVLEGSVRKASNRVRITGQLIDTASGAHIWADRIEAFGRLADRPLDLGQTERGLDCADDAARHLVLQFEDVVEGAVAGLSAIEQALALNPNCARAWTFCGWARG